MPDAQRESGHRENDERDYDQEFIGRRFDHDEAAAGADQPK